MAKINTIKYSKMQTSRQCGSILYFYYITISVIMLAVSMSLSQKVKLVVVPLDRGLPVQTVFHAAANKIRLERVLLSQHCWQSICS